MSQNTQASSGRRTIRKATAADLEVGLICADGDGNRVRIDHLDRDGDKLSYHFLNDELRVQEGVLESSIQDFLSEGWYVASGSANL
jgi:hypothetical protein